MDIAGASAFVTGGANGLGLATAIALARRGAALAIVDVSVQALEEAKRAVLAAGAPLVTTHCADISKADDVDRAAGEALSAHGGVQIVFANAGVGLVGLPLRQTRSVDARWLFDVNVLGVFETARALLPSMIDSGKPGAFICTASLAALATVPGAHAGLYSASKFAVAALAEAIREECGQAPIQVSTLYPGPIATNIAGNVEALRPGGGVASALPPFLAQATEDMGLSPAAAADIVLQGIEAGLPYIFTHPDVSEMAHRQYSGTILGGVEASRNLKGIFRQGVE